jgi:hypothetical protein
MKTNKKASSEHAKTAYLTQNKQKKTYKNASTEHAKSAYVTQNKQKKQTKRHQQNMLHQVMSHTTSQKNKQTGLNRTC